MTRLISAVLLAFAAFAATAQTRLDVVSEPEGATVWIDGQDKGLTPVTLFDLKPGQHHIKYAKPGYEECDRFFVLEDMVPLQRSVTLEPVRGILLLKSEPEGCGIEIDGCALGTTPRLITALEARIPHRVTLSRAGYRPSSFDIRFEGRKPLVRKEALVLDSGIVDIVSDPAGAEVTVNGIVRGRSPLQVTDVPKGRATVQFKLDGYANEVRELSVNAGDRQTLSVVMQGLPGTLSLVSLPEGARFYVNDEFRGKTQVTVSSLKPGTYKVRAELDGYGTVERDVELANGASRREEFRLSNVMGRLEIRTSPPGTQVLLDGRARGLTKAVGRDEEFSAVLTIPDVLEGEHTVTLRCDGYSETVLHPRIENSKTKQLSVRMKRVFKPDVEIVTATGSFVGRLVSMRNGSVTIEIKLGVERCFPGESVRKINYLKDGK